MDDAANETLRRVEAFQKLVAVRIRLDHLASTLRASLPGALGVLGDRISGQTSFEELLNDHEYDDTDVVAIAEHLFAFLNGTDGGAARDRFSRFVKDLVGALSRESFTGRSLGAIDREIGRDPEFARVCARFDEEKVDALEAEYADVLAHLSIQLNLHTEFSNNGMSAELQSAEGAVPLLQHAVMLGRRTLRNQDGRPSGGRGKRADNQSDLIGKALKLAGFLAPRRGSKTES